MNLELKALRRLIVDISDMEIATITFRLHAPWVHSLLAIRSEIETWRAKKDSEDANAKYNEMLYYGLGNNEED